MRSFCVFSVFCFILTNYYTQAFLEEEESVEEIVAKLQVTVKGLQGQIAALGNQSCGCGTKPPVFMAALSADLTHCTKYQPVIFDSVKINQGSGYDSNHGIFTAPVSGVYSFSTTLSVIPNNKYHVAIVQGNATNEIGYLYTDPQNIWLQRSTTVFTHLQQNEEMWMVCLDDSRIEGDHQHGWEGANDYHSHMSGFLVSAD